MSEKRKDNKNRLLRNGESQRADNRYAYKYKDIDGKVQFVYAWKLVKTDRTPSGKREDLSLREKEEEIDARLKQGLKKDQSITVGELITKVMALKSGMKDGTYKNYQTRANQIKKTNIWNKKASKIKKSDAKQYLIQLSPQYQYTTIKALKILLRQAFQVAIEDHQIFENPFDFSMQGLLQNDTKDKEALTVAEEKSFMAFIKESPNYAKYYDALYVLFRTGLRIGEFCALTVHDIHFEERYISIERQVVRDRKSQNKIAKPKSKKSIRLIPMSRDLESVLRKVISEMPKDGPQLDGIEGFLFISRYGEVLNNVAWSKRFELMQRDYNLLHSEHPIAVTPHICRHTFCTRMAMSGMNPRVLQKIMGHSKIDVTMEVYTTVGFDDMLVEVDKTESNKKTIQLKIAS